MKKSKHCRVHRVRTTSGLVVGFYRKREGEGERGMEGGEGESEKRREKRGGRANGSGEGA
jgi:hypothetical protein